MRIPKRSLGTLVFAAGMSITGLSQAAPIRIIPEPLPPSATLTPMHGSESVLAGALQDPPQPGSLCACISRDRSVPVDSACTPAPVGAGSSAGSAESRATVALAAALLDGPHRPALQSVMSGGGSDLSSLLTGLQFLLVPEKLADLPPALPVPVDTATGLGGGGGGSHLEITADPPPASGPTLPDGLPLPPEPPFPAPPEDPAVTDAIPVVPLPATGLLLIGAIVATLGLRRRAR